MVRLFRWLFWLVALAAVVWFATTVQLGRRTLLGHIVAIAGTREAHDLADGTKEEASKVVEHVRGDLKRDGGVPSKQVAEKLTDADREALRKLAREKSQ